MFFLAPLLASLAGSGLDLIRGAIVSKGKEAVEKAIGVKISDNPSPEELFKLKQLEADHEEKLMELAIETQRLNLESEKIQAEVSKNENDNVSERWKADMSSDSWLSKNIRPLCLLIFLGLLLLVLVLAACKVHYDDSIVTLLKDPMLAAFFAYFGGRSYEKVQQTKAGGKK